MPTPSAARGILEAIYWKPQIRWIIDRIHVLAPIRFANIRRNEVAQEISYRNITGAMASGEAISLAIEEQRQQRASLLLRDVDYVFEAHFEVLDFRFEKNGPELHGEGLRRQTPRCLQPPCAGWPIPSRAGAGMSRISRAFRFSGRRTAQIANPGQARDLGFMLYDIDFANGITPMFYRPQMIDGVIDVQASLKNSPLGE